MTRGKVSIESAFTRLERAERMAKVLAIPVPQETLAEQQARIAKGAQVLTAVTRNRQNLVQYLQDYRKDINSNQVPPAYNPKNDLPQRMVELYKLRAQKYLSTLISRAQTRPPWVNQNIATMAELPEEKMCYYDMTKQERREFWNQFFDDIAYELFHSLLGVVNLTPLFKGPHRGYYQYAVATMCDMACTHSIAPRLTEFFVTTRVESSVINGAHLTTYLGYDIRTAFKKAANTVSMQDVWKTMPSAYNNREGGTLTPKYEDIILFRDVRKRGSPFPLAKKMPHTVGELNAPFVPV